MLLNEVIYNSLNRGGGIIASKSTLRPSTAHTSNFKEDLKKNYIPISVDAEKLIEKHLKIKKIETGKNFNKILK